MSGDDPDQSKKMPMHTRLLCLCAAASTSTSEESHRPGTQESHEHEPTSEESHEPTESAEQKQAWLSNVIESMFQKPVQVMAQHLDVIKDDLNLAVSSETISQELYESLEYNLDSLMQYTDMIDNADDFHKIGGFDVLVPLLQIPHPVVRAKTAELIADLVQNNNYCQKKALETNLLPILFEMLDTDPDETVCIKSLYAISCLCRHNASALQYLSEVDGLSKLLRAIQKPSEKLRTKAAFLLTHLCDQLPEIRDTLFGMGLIQLLACLLQTEFKPSHEHLLSALLSLVSQHESSQKECLNPKLGLKDSVQIHMHFVQEAYPECHEVKDYLSRLLTYCVPNARDSNEEDMKTAEEMER